MGLLAVLPRRLSGWESCGPPTAEAYGSLLCAPQGSGEGEVAEAALWSLVVPLTFLRQKTWKGKYVLKAL